MHARAETSVRVLSSQIIVFSLRSLCRRQDRPRHEPPSVGTPTQRARFAESGLVDERERQVRCDDAAATGSAEQQRMVRRARARDSAGRTGSVTREGAGYRRVRLPPRRSERWHLLRPFGRRSLRRHRLVGQGIDRRGGRSARVVRGNRAGRWRCAHPRCLGGRPLDGAAPAAPSPDGNSRQRSARLAASGTTARAKASGRALVARGPGAGASQGPTRALSDQPVRGIWSAKGRAAAPSAGLAGAPRHDALAHPSDRQRIAPADGEGVDHSVRAGWRACPRSRPAQGSGAGLDLVMSPAQTSRMETAEHRSALGQWQTAQRPADPRLRAYVHGYAGSSSALHAPVQERHVPSTEVPLLLTFGAAHQRLDTAGSGEWTARDGVWVVGLHDRHQLTEAAGERHFMVVRFTPMGAHLFLGLPMHLIANQAVDLELIDPALARIVVSRIGVAGSWTDRFAAIELLIAERVADAAIPASIDWAWRRLVAADGRVALG